MGLRKVLSNLFSQRLTLNVNGEEYAVFGRLTPMQTLTKESSSSYIIRNTCRCYVVADKGIELPEIDTKDIIRTTFWRTDEGGERVTPFYYLKTIKKCYDERGDLHHYEIDGEEEE